MLFLLNLNSLHASTAQNGIIPSQFKTNYFSLGAELTYLTTSANYTDSGTSLDFDSSYGYSAYQTLVYGRYDFSNQLSVFSELPMNYAQSENPTDTYSGFKVAGVTLGTNYDLKTSFISVIPQFKSYFAIEKFDRSSDEILTSDGTSYFDIGSHFFKNFSSLIWHGFLSYQYRLEGFSSLLNYQTDVSYKAQNFSIAFGVRGFESVTKDENSDNPLYRHGYLAVVNGGSVMYGAVDPARTDLFTQLKFALADSMDFYGAINKSIRGKNSGDMLTVTAGFEYFFGSGGSSNKTLQEKDNFKYEDEAIDPAIEEQIKTYNKPKPIKKKKPKKIIKPKTKKQSGNFTEVSSDNDLVVSKKQLGKKSTSTSPIKSKPRSKKPTRVNIDF